jgi:hypothetical protein
MLFALPSTSERVVVVALPQVLEGRLDSLLMYGACLPHVWEQRLHGGLPLMRENLIVKRGSQRGLVVMVVSGFENVSESKSDGRGISGEGRCDLPVVAEAEEGLRLRLLRLGTQPLMFSSHWSVASSHYFTIAFRRT